LEQDGEYGYEPAVSETDQRNGKTVNSLVMIRYLGEHDGNIRWSSVVNGQALVLSCKQPCEFVTMAGYVSGMEVEHETSRVAPGSIMDEILQDIDADQLKVYGAGKR
jgi:hypothetical protein